MTFWNILYTNVFSKSQKIKSTNINMILLMTGSRIGSTCVLYTPCGVPPGWLHSVIMSLQSHSWPHHSCRYLFVTGTSFHNLASRANASPRIGDCFQRGHRTGSVQCYHPRPNFRSTSGTTSGSRATPATVPYCNTPAAAESKLRHSAREWWIPTPVLR